MNNENYPVYKITTFPEDTNSVDNVDDIYIAYIDGDLLECLNAMNLPKNIEVLTEKLREKPEKVD